MVYTYDEYIKNLKNINRIQQEYIRNLEQISHLYNEFIKNIERVNELYNKFIASYEKLGGLIIRTTISEYAKNEPEMARPLFKTMGTIAK